MSSKREIKTAGLLCMQCNMILGGAKDSPSILTAAIQYLARAGDL